MVMFRVRCHGKVSVIGLCLSVVYPELVSASGGFPSQVKVGASKGCHLG